MCHSPQLLVDVFNEEIVLRICMVRLLHSIRRDVADDGILCAIGVEELQTLMESEWHDVVFVDPRHS